MSKIGVAGACGKMGRRISTLLFKESQDILALERKGHPEIGKDISVILENMDFPKGVGVAITDDLEALCQSIDCLVDFTLPEPTMEHLECCVKNNVAMVIGTTGIDAGGEEKILEASKTIPIVFSPNMSIGVNVLFKIVSEASRVLGDGFDIKVDETHHVHKKDSPSGTAKMIGKVIKEACGKDPHIEAFREGEVVGNHGIVFDNEVETLEIRHNAKTRDIFVAGAIKAVKFIVSKAPGLYNMQDVLGLN